MIRTLCKPTDRWWSFSTATNGWIPVHGNQRIATEVEMQRKVCIWSAMEGTIAGLVWCFQLNGELLVARWWSGGACWNSTSPRLLIAMIAFYPRWHEEEWRHPFQPFGRVQQIWWTIHNEITITGRMGHWSCSISMHSSLLVDSSRRVLATTRRACSWRVLSHRFLVLQPQEDTGASCHIVTVYWPCLLVVGNGCK
jgi:hypothetical protein